MSISYSWSACWFDFCFCLVIIFCLCLLFVVVSSAVTTSAVKCMQILNTRIRSDGPCVEWNVKVNLCSWNQLIVYTLQPHCRHWRHSSVHWRRNCSVDHTATHTTGTIDSSVTRDTPAPLKFCLRLASRWNSLRMMMTFHWQLYLPHVGPGLPSFPPLIHLLPHLSPFYFSLSFFGFTYFLLLSIPSLSTRIVPLRFQAGGRRKRPNLGLVCRVCVICIP